MELDTLTSITSIDKLKCASCKKYLSYFPIWVCSNNQNICGRCITPEDETVFQNIAFETLSQFLKFPCRYKDEGCKEELQPKKVPAHEKDCPFRVITCPVRKFNACNWEGSRPDTLHHCHSDHSNMFVTNREIPLDLTCSDEKYYLVEHENLLLIFRSTFDVNKKVLLFEMYTSEFELHVKKYFCQLNAKSGNKNLSVDFNTTCFAEVTPNELKMESIMTQTHDNDASLKISIGDIIENPNEVVNLEMLSVLKCFVCSEYAVPPIYHCVKNSDALCSDCQNKHIAACNLCLRNNSSTRNINLDKMANLLNYPCKYQQNGCTYVSKPDKIKKHQSVCELGDFECPINEFESCCWKGLCKDLEEHIQNHQELVTNSAQISKQLQPQRMKCDIIKFSNQLFRLVCMKTPDEKFLWTVQVIGPVKEEYKYEIEIVDPSNKGRRLLVRQVCGELTKREQLFKNGDSYCYFMKDQIKEFVADQTVTFKVHIFV